MIHSTRLFLIANVGLPTSSLIHRSNTECSLNIVFFRENFVIFLNSAGSAAALVFYLPGVCTHTDTEGKQKRTEFGIFQKKIGKKHNI